MDGYKFPHEQEEEKKAQKEPELQIEIEGEGDVEIIDDTPDQDKGKEPLPSPPEDVSDDELSKYSESVRTRIQKFSKGYHDERRAKEAAVREKEEALAFAQRLAEENKKLQGSLGQGQQALLEQAKNTVAREVEDAKRKYKEAYEAGDTEGVVAAQEALTAAKIKSDRLANFKPTPLQQEKTEVQTSSRPQEPQYDAKSTAWRQANPWFGSNKRMTALALAVHQELVEKGVDTTSDEYYGEINAAMRKTFPDAFPQEKSTVKKSNVVAPATRSTAPKKIVLTQSQVNIAKRLGLPLEVYARQVAEEMRKENV